MTRAPTPDRIAILGFLPGARPVPRDMTTLIEGFVRAGVRVDLLLPPEIRPDCVDVGAEVGIHRLDLVREDEALAALKAYVRDRRPDFLLSNRDRASALLARLPVGESPYRVFRIGTDVLARTKGKNLLARWRARRRLAEIFSRADGLIGVSDGACSSLRELLRGRRTPPISRVYSPLDREGIARLAREPVSHPWLAREGPPLVLSVGRLVRTKDQATLLKAFRRVLDRRECRLLILGEGRQRPKLEALVTKLRIAGAVELPGFVSNPFPYMAGADLFVLSSVFEGFGNVLAESLALGTPCVSTDCKSGPGEILGNGRFGKLVPVGDVERLADAIGSALDQIPRSEILRQAALRFDRDAVVEDLLRVLRAIP
jgi:glycosyltransferase involved in cell wall biosynthesis